jgi:hypothetical protein
VLRVHESRHHEAAARHKTAQSLARLALACPRCHEVPATFLDHRATCNRRGSKGEVTVGFVSAFGEVGAARFDPVHTTIAERDDHLGTWRHQYEEQCSAIAAALSPGRLALDLRCGPDAPYEKPAGPLAVSTDPSLSSLAANCDFDLGLHASAAGLPSALTAMGRMTFLEACLEMRR